MDRLLGRLLLLAGALIVVGSLLPWHILRGFDIDLNIDGIDTPNNGVVTLVFGVIIVGLAFRMVDTGVRPRRLVLVVVLVTAAATVWALLDASNAENDIAGGGASGAALRAAIDLDRAYGQWVLLAGAGLAVVAGLLLARRHDGEPAASDGAPPV